MYYFRSNFDGMKNWFLGFVVIWMMGMYACTTEIDLTAPYKDITIVYGLLDSKKDTQWVRVNKAYLGEGDALMFAQISDSLYYDSAFVYLLSYQNGNKVDSIVLNKIIDPFPKDSGIFANNINILYYTTSTLTTNKIYKLFVRIPSKDKTVSSWTSLVKNLLMSYPSSPSTILTFEDITGVNPDPTTTIKWLKDDSTYAYQLAFRFNYYEWLGTDTANKTLKNFVKTFPLFKPDATNIVGNEIYHGIQKSQFYGAIATYVLPNPTGTPSNQMKARKFHSLDFIVYQAGRELYNYMTINAPSLSIVQKVTDYTNIYNGLGLFSSRSKGGLDGIKLNTRTQDSIKWGQYTGNLNFK